MGRSKSFREIDEIVSKFDRTVSALCDQLVRMPDIEIARLRDTFSALEDARRVGLARNLKRGEELRIKMKLAPARRAAYEKILSENAPLLYAERVNRQGYGEAAVYALTRCADQKLPLPNWTRDTLAGIARGTVKIEKHGKGSRAFQLHQYARDAERFQAVERAEAGEQTGANRGVDRFDRALELLRGSWADTSYKGVRDSYYRFKRQRGLYYHNREHVLRAILRFVAPTLSRFIPD